MKIEFKKRILSSIILIPISFFFIIKSTFLFNFFLFFCFCLSIYEWHNMSNKKNYYIFGIIFLCISFYLTYSLRHNPNYIGISFFIFVIIICIATDIGGYIFGKIFKGPKITKISPNKTYSGMMGSYLFAIISSFLLINNSNLIEGKTYEITIELFFFVLTISTTSQIGDLIVSFFKRLSKIKDTGKLIPGHGGLLDRIDGLLFAMPIAYVILNFIILK
tara:strand:+ start:132 stop:788 length:657 start_codon:yes stop_codon:yes gene_type:complete